MQKSVGTRADVWAGIARKTSGGLTKDDLFMDGTAIKSKRKSEMAKARNFAARLKVAGSGPAIPANLQRASMSGIGLVGGARGEFLRKILNVAKILAPAVAGALTSEKAMQLGDLVVSGMVASGIPQVAIAGATIGSLRPFVRAALQIIASQEKAEKKPAVRRGRGVVLPGGALVMPRA